MYFICIPVRASGNHRIRSRYNTRGANTNVSSHMSEGGMASRYKVPYLHDTSKVQTSKKDTVQYRCRFMYPACTVSGPPFINASWTCAAFLAGALRGPSTIRSLGVTSSGISRMESPKIRSANDLPSYHGTPP